MMLCRITLIRLEIHNLQKQYSLAEILQTCDRHTDMDMYRYQFEAKCLTHQRYMFTICRHSILHIATFQLIEFKSKWCLYYFKLMSLFIFYFFIIYPYSPSCVWSCSNGVNDPMNIWSMTSMNAGGGGVGDPDLVTTLLKCFTIWLSKFLCSIWHANN